MNTKHTRCPVRVLNPDNSPFSNGAKRKALLDAAPELLAALERIVKINGSTGGPEALIAEYKHIARAAIAKARNE